MKIKRILALVLTALMCMTFMSVGASAADAKGVKLNKTSAEMAVGETLTLTRTVTGFTKCTLQWSTSDKSVAEVTPGTVTAKKVGTATITVKIKGTDYKATCKITVKEKSAASKSDSTKTKTVSYKAASEIVDKMTIGWNLGNTLDSVNCSWYSKNDVDYEMAWGNPKTTKAMITAVKNAGFNTVRIPVSWGEHMDSSGKINDEWLNRVKEIVDYAYSNDMYIILNSHHDLSWEKFDEKNYEASLKKYTYVWKQIAAKFKNYDQKLIFEGMNEPRTEGSAQEWNGGTKAEREILNKFYASFVKTVRDSGGNNASRLLLLTPYGANAGVAAMSDLELPDDNMIAVSVHAYLPYNVALNRYSDDKKLNDNNKKEIDNTFANINKVFLSKGVPVIMDEFGSINKSNTAERVTLAKYYLSVSESYGVPCVWWDNGSNCAPKDGEGFGLLNRKTLEWYYPDIVKALTDSVK